MRFTPFTGLSAQKKVTATPVQPAAPLIRSGVRQLTVEAKVLTRREHRDQRHRRIRGKVIDDTVGSTLAAASTLTPEIREKLNGSAACNVEAAKLVGQKIAEICKERNIERVCFDRGGYRYHGRVQALAEAAREGGLDF
ncbi:hypothetical protein N2152v2_003543 [Parachlorella kessleri]